MCIHPTSLSNRLRKRPVATGQPPVFDFQVKRGNWQPDRPKFGRTGNRSPVATVIGPVRLPVFLKSCDRTLIHYLGGSTLGRQELWILDNHDLATHTNCWPKLAIMLRSMYVSLATDLFNTIVT